RNRFFASQTVQHDADLLLRAILLAGDPANVLDHLLRRRLCRFHFLSHRRSFEGYDEPEILLSQFARICLIGADAGQNTTRRPYGSAATCRRIRTLPRSALW